MFHCTLIITIMLFIIDIKYFWNWNRTCCFKQYWSHIILVPYHYN